MAPSDSNSPHTDLKVKPWSAEHALTGAFACALIEKQFPELKPVHAHYLGAGWDNTVFLINDTWVFRFPRREVAVELLDHEKITLHALQGFPLDYPQPVFYGQPVLPDQPTSVGDQHYPWPFMGYKKVAGTTACRANVNRQGRAQWVKPLALALKHLHTQPVPQHLPGDTLQRSNLNHRLAWFQDQWAQAKVAAEQQQQHLPEKAVARLLKKLEAIATASSSASQSSPEAATHLLHGDLYIRHLMVNVRNELTGFIDWGDTHHGDISTDLGIVYSALPPERHDAFWSHYGKVSEVTQRKAQFRALYSCLYIYRYGLDMQDQDLVREGWQGMQWIASLFP